MPKTHCARSRPGPGKHGPSAHTCKPNWEDCYRAQRTVVGLPEYLGSKGVQSHAPIPYGCPSDWSQQADRHRPCNPRSAPGAVSIVGPLDLERHSSSSDNPIQPVRACKSVLCLVGPKTAKL